MYNLYTLSNFIESGALAIILRKHALQLVRMVILNMNYIFNMQLTEQH